MANAAIVASKPTRTNANGARLTAIVSAAL
jgi:hypothetical protein